MLEKTRRLIVGKSFLGRDSLGKHADFRKANWKNMLRRYAMLVWLPPLRVDDFRIWWLSHLKKPVNRTIGNSRVVLWNISEMRKVRAEVSPPRNSFDLILTTQFTIEVDNRVHHETLCWLFAANVINKRKAFIRDNLLGHNGHLLRPAELPFRQYEKTNL